jgi:hypothetical protein
MRSEAKSNFTGTGCDLTSVVRRYQKSWSGARKFNTQQTLFLFRMHSQFTMKVVVLPGDKP